MDKISPFHIKNFRKQTGLSQKAFAQAVDLPTRTYRSYETGERGLTIDKFRELKEKLGYYENLSQDVAILVASFSESCSRICRFLV